ncbi:MAG: tRNA pseudouridine(38-40) synthase TruA [Candidatus Dependentiae bacterium]|nr:tRNA pseudouridine(38-40) synthase TruA [Candidatus Dependentiae bacterium]
MLNSYKIIIAYDGTDYFGWQRQKDRPSIAQTLQDVFYTVFNKSIVLRGVSRTDAGVHALGQVAIFSVVMNIDPKVMIHAWNNRLSAEIVIRSIERIPSDFSLHGNVVTKTYWYHFFLERPLPTTQRFGWFFRYPVDLEKLQQCLNVFLGTHDFRSFCSGDERGDDTIRRIDAVSIEYVEKYNAYRIAIVGPKFLRYMIRRMSGACIEVASRKDLDVGLLKQVLEAKNPEHLLPNAPAKGLVLYEVEYKS